MESQARHTTGHMVVLGHHRASGIIHASLHWTGILAYPMRGITRSKCSSNSSVVHSSKRSLRLRWHSRQPHPHHLLIHHHPRRHQGSHARKSRRRHNRIMSVVTSASTICQCRMQHRVHPRSPSAQPPAVPMPNVRITSLSRPPALGPELDHVTGNLLASLVACAVISKMRALSPHRGQATRPMPPAA